MEDVETSESYADWTVEDLKNEAKARGLTYSGMVKADLVELLESDDENLELEDDEEEEDDEETVEYQHEFGTCVPLGPCTHPVEASDDDESDEEDDEETEEE